MLLKKKPCLCLNSMTDVRSAQKTGYSVMNLPLRSVNTPCLACSRVTPITSGCVLLTHMASADPPGCQKPSLQWILQSLRDFMVKNLFNYNYNYSALCVRISVKSCFLFLTAARLGGNLEIVTYLDDLEGSVNLHAYLVLAYLIL